MNMGMGMDMGIWHGSRIPLSRVSQNDSAGGGQAYGIVTKKSEKIGVTRGAEELA